MIKVKDLHKSFGSITAVDGLSFDIKKGQIVGLLGPNGAGKSTTMRLITGYISPDSGSISVNNQDLSQNLKEVQQQIGYLPENNPLYKNMLVSEALSLTAELKKIPSKKRKQAIHFAVDSVDIGDVYYRPIHELSKGYRQRVGMAQALMSKPKILIMDEPTEGLDPNQRAEVRSLIKNLGKNRTIIVSTHVMQEATAIANRILIISKGKLAADGTPDQLVSQQKNHHRLVAEIQGTKIKTTLQKLPQITSIKTKRLRNQTYKLDIALDSKDPIQPELAKLAAKNKWVIWSLQEPDRNLESVFNRLTDQKT